MASITKLTRAHGVSYRAEVYHRGQRQTQTFRTAQEARAWAVDAETSFKASGTVIPNLKFSDLLNKYKSEVLPQRKGKLWEGYAIARLDGGTLAGTRLRDLDATHVAKWRDTRLKAVSDATVRREWGLLSSICGLAVREWKWLARNPFKDADRPQGAAARERVLEPEEYTAIEKIAELDPDMWRVVRFALETAMRMGEIVSMDWGMIDMKKRTCRLPMTKNGHPRTVPLSAAALALLKEVPGTGSVWGMTVAQIDKRWRTLRDGAGIEGITFHDLRRTAASRMAKVLSGLELAKLLGHRDLRQTLNTYYKEDSQAIADKLDSQFTNSE